YGLRIKKGSPFPYTYVIGASGIADRRTIPPTYLHHPQTLKAARTGKHILCEKPMALNLSQAEEMIRVCQENGVKLTCWYPPIERAWRQQVELGGTPPCYPPELGLHNLRIVLVAYESAK
ncbi:MAG: Gfo/Idh/MocA family protein, partial [Candidatus Bipolaricaulia bacterium]